MTPAEFRATCESIGLNVEATAAVLGVTDRSVRRWNNGTVPVNDGAAAALADVVERTDQIVQFEAARAREAGVVETYASDTDFRDAHLALALAGFDARWHRAAAFRIAHAAGVPMRYQEH